MLLPKSDNILIKRDNWEIFERFERERDKLIEENNKNSQYISSKTEASGWIPQSEQNMVNSA